MGTAGCRSGWGVFLCQPCPGGSTQPWEQDKFLPSLPLLQSPHDFPSLPFAASSIATMRPFQQSP